MIGFHIIGVVSGCSEEKLCCSITSQARLISRQGRAGEGEQMTPECCYPFSEELYCSAAVASRSQRREQLLWELGKESVSGDRSHGMAVHLKHQSCQTRTSGARTPGLANCANGGAVCGSMHSASPHSHRGQASPLGWHSGSCWWQVVAGGAAGGSWWWQLAAGGNWW